MTNEQRKVFIETNFGNVVDSMVKTQGQGWKIVLKANATTFIQANGGKVEIVDSGLLECLNQLKRLARTTTATTKVQAAPAKKIPSKK